MSRLAQNPRAKILIIGNELLSGMRSDRNGATIARFLSSLGFQIGRITIAGDREADIREALHAAEANSDLIVCTGGLGSTRDDRTAGSIAREWNAPLRHDPGMMSRLTEKLALRRRPLTPRLKTFARIPIGATPLVNPAGLAEGVFMPCIAGSCKPALIALPGVPHELEAMLDSSVDPALREYFPRLKPRSSHVLGLSGIGEGELEDLFLDRAEFRRGEVSILPSPGIVYVVTTSRLLAKLVIRRAGRHVFTTTGEKIEEALVRILSEKQLTLSTAESCTGGLLSELITSVPGASKVYNGGMTVYTNRAKQNWLGVSRNILDQYGAVSEETALALSRGARSAAGSDWAISITGVAGPGGGSKKKPVGTVCIGLAGGGKVTACRFHFTGDRSEIRLRSARKAMELLLNRLRPRAAIPRRTR